MVSAVGLPVASAAGPVFVETDVTQDTTWTADDGPYRIVANVSVAPDATLRIEPRTEVQVAEGTSLSVAGELVAEGIPDEPITFTSPRANLSRGTWGSIRATGDSAVTVSLRHVVIEYATDGLRVVNAATKTTVENVRFADLAGDGVAVTASRSGTELAVTDSTFGDIGGGAITAGDEGPRFHGSRASASRTSPSNPRMARNWTGTGRKCRASGSPTPESVTRREGNRHRGRRTTELGHREERDNPLR